jgi:hypothetical protein
MSEQNTAHTSTEEGHPDLEREDRSDRDLGGPSTSERAEGVEETGGAKGDRPTEGHDPHE